MPSPDPVVRAAYARKWYSDPVNAAKHKERTNAARRRAFDHIGRRIAAVKDRPCHDCRGSFPAVCMDFDHVRGVKLADVSALRRARRPWSVIEAEIAKCDVVCANCHRIRTEQRRLEAVESLARDGAAR